MISLRLMWPIIIVLVIFGARYWSLYEAAHAKYVQISMKSSVPGVAQIFYDIGQGFTEENSSKTTISVSEAFREYRFPFPDNKKIFNLRFDPLASSGHVEIRRIGITDGPGNTFLGFHPKQLVPANQIKKLDINYDHISVDMDTNAGDPQIYIRLEKPFLQEVHPSYHRTLFLNFCIILLSVFLIYLWVNWNDDKKIKKGLCYSLITIGIAVVIFFLMQTCLGILNRSIPAVPAGDTEVFIYMAGLKWTDPSFFYGPRPWTVPLPYSLVNGAKNTQNLILLQTIISYVSWIFLAFVTMHFLRDYLTKIFAFVLIVFIPLNQSIEKVAFVILSESYSLSFLAFFIGSYIWYYNKRSIPSVIFLAIVALLFAFTRDTDAYRVLFMTLPVLLLIGLHVRNKSHGVTQHIALFIAFIFIFIGADLSSSNIHCRDRIEPLSSAQWHANPADSLHFRVNDCLAPYTNARWHMPIVNNMFQRILPFENRVKYFEAHGLPVTTELMSMKHKWAQSHNWQWYMDPRLAAQREWNYRYGRQTYMKYLITHPKYVVSSAFDYRYLLLYPNGERNIWYKSAKPIEARMLSVFFPNDDVDLKMFLALFFFSLILLFIIYFRHGK